MNKKIVIVGAGVAGINAATKLVDNGYPGELITIIDMGKDPYNRKAEEAIAMVSNKEDARPPGLIAAEEERLQK